jgi:hypothetical protein
MHGASSHKVHIAPECVSLVAKAHSKDCIPVTSVSQCLLIMRSRCCQKVQCDVKAFALEASQGGGAR